MKFHFIVTQWFIIFHESCISHGHCMLLDILHQYKLCTSEHIIKLALNVIFVSYNSGIFVCGSHSNI